MSTRFKAVDRETPYILPPSVQDWLPEQHLARFGVGVGVVAEPEAGTGDARFDSVSVYRGQHASGPRHDRELPEAVFEAVGAIVCTDPAVGEDFGVFETGEDQPGGK